MTAEEKQQELNSKDWTVYPDDLGYSTWTARRAYHGNLPTFYVSKGRDVFRYDNCFHMYIHCSHLRPVTLKMVARRVASGRKCSMAR